MVRGNIALVQYFNTLRPRRNEQHFADDIFKRIFFNENVWISNKISLKFVPSGPINNIPALVQIMVWHRSGDKPLSEPMMVRLPTHICVTRPQWVNKSDIEIALKRRDLLVVFLIWCKNVIYLIIIVVIQCMWLNYNSQINNILDDTV